MESPFIKVVGFAGSASLLKKDSNTGGFFCGISETFKNLYFVKHLQTAASVFLEAFNLDMLRDKRRRFIRMFQKDETTISPPPRHLKKRLVERLKVSVENSS